MITTNDSTRIKTFQEFRQEILDAANWYADKCISLWERDSSETEESLKIVFERLELDRKAIIENLDDYILELFILNERKPELRNYIVFTSFMQVFEGDAHGEPDYEECLERYSFCLASVKDLIETPLSIDEWFTPQDLEWIREFYDHYKRP